MKSLIRYFLLSVVFEPRGNVPVRLFALLLYCIILLEHWVTAADAPEELPDVVRRWWKWSISPPLTPRHVPLNDDDCAICMNLLSASVVTCDNHHQLHLHCYRDYITRADTAKPLCVFRCRTPYRYITHH